MQGVLTHRFCPASLSSDAPDDKTPIVKAAEPKAAAVKKVLKLKNEAPGKSWEDTLHASVSAYGAKANHSSS